MRNLILIFTILAGSSGILAEGANANPVDDQCFAQYGRAAGQCNSEYPNNEAAFIECLAGPKRGLVNCCKQDGASPDCDADAQTVSAVEQPHKCAADALVQARKLLEFHFGGPDDRMDVDREAKPVHPIKNPAGDDKYDVLEIWAQIYKGRYRMHFIYGYAGNECVLVGQEILEYANL